MHLGATEKLYLYTSIFAPGRLATVVVHSWEWFDPMSRRWIPQSRVPFSIRGGREGGYRAYSIKSRPRPGDWRVNITTDDGRPMGRIRFAVTISPPPQALEHKVLN
jgi:hypothetical protein